MTDFWDDYYRLFGVGADASAAQVRRAWRKLALRWHPDRAGPETTVIFQKLSAAYSVLSDPIARAAYNRRHGLPLPRFESGAGSTAAGRQAGTSGGPVAPRRRAPGVMLSRITGPLAGLLACGVARRAADDTIELYLEPHEAAQGGMATIAMRVPVRCSSCNGSGAGCSHCAARGTTDELFSAWLAVPPEVDDGAILEPSVLLHGMQPVRFRVRVAGGPDISRG